MLERLCASINKAVLKGPQPGFRILVVPPRISHQITDENANLLSRNKLTEHECVLPRLRAVGLTMADIATVAPQPLPLIGSFAAGVLTPAAQAPHIRPDEINAPLRRKKAFLCRVNENTPVDERQTVAVGKMVYHIPGFRVINAANYQVMLRTV